MIDKMFNTGSDNQCSMTYHTVKLPLAIFVNIYSVNSPILCS